MLKEIHSSPPAVDFLFFVVRCVDRVLVEAEVIGDVGKKAICNDRFDIRKVRPGASPATLSSTATTTSTTSCLTESAAALTSFISSATLTCTATATLSP
jgi:hypothetical protein